MGVFCFGKWKCLAFQFVSICWPSGLEQSDLERIDCSAFDLRMISNTSQRKKPSDGVKKRFQDLQSSFFFL